MNIELVGGPHDGTRMTVRDGQWELLMYLPPVAPWVMWGCTLSAVRIVQSLVERPGRTVRAWPHQ